MAPFPVRSATFLRYIAIWFGWQVVSLAALGQTAAHWGPPIDFKSSTNSSSGASVAKPRLEGDFSYEVWPVGLGTYSGQYIVDAQKQQKPDGYGLFLPTDKAYSHEQFDGNWNEGAALSGVYKYANGWQWFGNLSDKNSLGALVKGSNAILQNVSWEQARLDALEHSPSPPAQPNEPNLFEILVITDPGNVSVDVVATDTQETFSKTSDAEGNLQFMVPAGNYQLRGAKPGYNQTNVFAQAGLNGNNRTIARVRLQTVNVETGLPKEDIIGGVVENLKRLTGDASFNYDIGPMFPDQFAIMVRNRAGKIQKILNSDPDTAKQPAVVSVVSLFWSKVAQAVIEGYRADRAKAAKEGRQDGNRRFLEVALGAIGAEWNYHYTPLSSTKTVFDNLNAQDSDNLILNYFPFPRDDHLEPADSVPSQLAKTNYLWQTWPTEVYYQSMAACILPKVLKVPVDNGGRDSNVLWMVLVPDAKGSLHSGTNNISWKPSAPFYMAATETTFEDMRLYQEWAQQALKAHPEWAKFATFSATKNFVGDKHAPYTGVTLDEAMSVCNWLSLCHGREPVYIRNLNVWTIGPSHNGFRLASDDEWQYAARFGFDFFAETNAPMWKQTQKNLDPFGSLGTSEAQAARRLVFSSTVTHTQTAPRLVDDANAELYPLGMRDLCGNAGELCQKTMSGFSLDWVVCGGSCDIMTESAVMPWASNDFREDAKLVGFRVILPVPMENFVMQ